MLPKLPQELFDKVVDALYNDHAALSACALAAKALSSRAQLHIFHTITLGPRSRAPLANNGLSLCHKFHNLIISSPHITTLVRKLVILEAMHDGFGIRWVYRDTVLPLVLAALSDSDSSSSNLESFVLSGRDSYTFWASMSFEVQTSIMRILQVYSLRHATFNRIYKFPPSVLTLFQNLEHLEMIDSCPEISILSPSDSSNHSCLQSLIFTDALTPIHPVLQWFYGPSSSFNLSNLKRLHVDLPRDANLHLEMQPNLSHLTIQTNFRAAYDPDTGMTAMSSRQWLYHHCNQFEHIAGNLTAVPLPFLEVLKIIMLVDNWGETIITANLTRSVSNGLELMGEPLAHWEALDAALALLPSLCHVQLILDVRHLPMKSDFYTLDLDAAFHARLPNASAGKMLLDVVRQNWNSALDLVY